MTAGAERERHRLQGLASHCDVSREAVAAAHPSAKCDRCSCARVQTVALYCGAPRAAPMTHPTSISTSSHSRFTGNTQCAGQCGPTCCSRRCCARDLRATTSSGRLRPGARRRFPCPGFTGNRASSRRRCLPRARARRCSKHCAARPLMNARRRAAELMAPSPHDSRGTSVTIRSLGLAMPRQGGPPKEDPGHRLEDRASAHGR